MLQICWDDSLKQFWKAEESIISNNFNKILSRLRFYTIRFYLDLKGVHLLCIHIFSKAFSWLQVQMVHFKMLEKQSNMVLRIHHCYHCCDHIQQVTFTYFNYYKIRIWIYSISLFYFILLFFYFKSCIELMSQMKRLRTSNVQKYEPLLGLFALSFYKGIYSYCISPWASVEDKMRFKWQFDSCV